MKNEKIDMVKVEEIASGKNADANELLTKNGMFANLEEFEKNFFENNNPLKF